MIPAPVPSSQPSNWQRALRNAVTSPDELVKLLELDEAWARPARSVANRFPLRVPREFIARMRRGDPADPLLRQVLPGQQVRLGPVLLYLHFRRLPETGWLPLTALAFLQFCFSYVLLL